MTHIEPGATRPWMLKQVQHDGWKRLGKSVVIPAKPEDED
jgi:hypothetical protein